MREIDQLAWRYGARPFRVYLVHHNWYVWALTAAYLVTLAFIPLPCFFQVMAVVLVVLVGVSAWTAWKAWQALCDLCVTLMMCELRL